MKVSQTGGLDVVQHNSVTDQVSVVRHQHPLVQERKGISAQHHGVCVDKSFRIGDRADTHFRAIQTAQGSVGGHNRGVVFLHRRQRIADVIPCIPIVCIQESDGFHSEADGVVTADEAWGGANVAMAAGQADVVRGPFVDPLSRVAISYQYMQAWFCLGKDTFVALLNNAEGFFEVRGDNGDFGAISHD